MKTVIIYASVHHNNMPEIPVIDMLPGTREEIVATLV